MLLCPKCKKKLIKIGNCYTCEEHHCYDIAKRGYCNLLLGHHKACGDNKEMVQARTSFLHKGYYAPLQKRIIELLQGLTIHTLVDAGCGEGYYTNAIQQAFPHMDIYGFDLSKHAVDKACKANSKVHYTVASIFDLPIPSLSVDGLLSIFAPISEKENMRILKHHGYFIKVEPGPKHLEGLKQLLYKNIYDNEAKAKQYDNMLLLQEELLDYEIFLETKKDIQSLFQMTPYYWKTAKEAADQLYELTQLKTRIQFHIEIYQKII